MNFFFNTIMVPPYWNTCTSCLHIPIYFHCFKCVPYHKDHYIYQTDLLIYISIKCADNKNPSVRMTLNISFGFEHMQYEERTVKDHQSTSEHSIPVQK